jgi:hypothetical protein
MVMVMLMRRWRRGRGGGRGGARVRMGSAREGEEEGARNGEASSFFFLYYRLGLGERIPFPSGPLEAHTSSSSLETLARADMGAEEDAASRRDRLRALRAAKELLANPDSQEQQYALHDSSSVGKHDSHIHDLLSAHVSFLC